MFFHRFKDEAGRWAQHHVGWVLLQQVVVRGAQALKFLLAARMLGPEAFALAAVAMTAVMVVEALSDTGLGPAMIQREHEVDKVAAGAVWSLQVFRGSLVCLLLLAAQAPIASLFKMPDAAPLVAIAALIPFWRTAVHPGYVLLQREHRFRTVSTVECSGALVDLSLTAFGLWLGWGPVAILCGSHASDLWRLGWSFVLRRQRMQPNLGWRSIEDLGRFGFWVWASTALGVLLNQFDKVIVARWLGSADFGQYQTASRLGQLVVADLPSAAAQHAFARLSRAWYVSVQGGRTLFMKYLGWVAAAAGLAAVLLAALAGPLLLHVLGPAWAGVAPVLRAQCLAMWVGALLAITAAQARAMGRPRWVTESVCVQGALLVVMAWPAVQWGGAVGMSLLAASAGAASLLVLLARIFRGMR